MYRYEKLPLPRLDSHPLYGPLRGKDLIEQFDAYRRHDVSTDKHPSSPRRRRHERQRREPIITEEAVIYVDVRIGRRLSGHDGIVHGGIISLLFDEAVGIGYECRCLSTMPTTCTREDIPPAFTVNLAVNFRNPLEVGTPARIEVYHERTDGRKVQFRARLTSRDGDRDHAEATCVYVVARSRL